MVTLKIGDVIKHYDRYYVVLEKTYGGFGVVNVRGPYSPGMVRYGLYDIATDPSDVIGGIRVVKPPYPDEFYQQVKNGMKYWTKNQNIMGKIIRRNPKVGDILVCANRYHVVVESKRHTRFFDISGVINVPDYRPYRTTLVIMKCNVISEEDVENEVRIDIVRPPYSHKLRAYIFKFLNVEDININMTWKE